VPDVQVSLEETGERDSSGDRQDPDKQGDGNKDEDLLLFSHAHNLSERYRRNPLDILAELQVLQFLKAHDARDQV